MLVITVLAYGKHWVHTGFGDKGNLASASIKISDFGRELTRLKIELGVEKGVVPFGARYHWSFFPFTKKELAICDWFGL